MNTIKRLVLGVLSCLLLAAGFVRAADRLDPLTQTLRVGNESVGAPQMGCIGGPCQQSNQET